MIVLVCTAVGVFSALGSRARIKRLAELRFRYLALVWIAVALQLIVFEGIGRFMPVWSVEAVHLATYALTVTFIAVNRHLPGRLLIAAGTGLNLLAIAANGGTMPADPEAWRRAGLPPIAPDAFNNSRALTDPHLAMLGDIFAIPAGWPLSSVFSIGDILIVVGGTYLAHRWCATRDVVPTERFELSLTRT